jgi:hypothetical protein
MTVQAFFIGGFLLAFGILSLKFNYQLVGFTGNVGSIEKWLGSGSTYGFFKFISILLCIVGFLYMFGLSDAFFTWLFSPLEQFFPKNNNAL